MDAEQGLAFVQRHGVVLQSARGAVPSLAEAIAGAPIRGSWWAHPEARVIYAVSQAVAASPDVLVCKLVDGKVTFVHRRLWPALVKLAAGFRDGQLDRVRDEHTASGAHRSRREPFPEWVPAGILKEAERLPAEEARRILSGLPGMPAADFSTLLAEVRACTLCAAHLPHGVRPVLQVHPRARVLVAGQAPGRMVHASGVPFDDTSGDRLRDWMGVSREVFYDPEQVAILPMGFCYPGTGKSGDLPPRPECAAAWRERLLSRLPDLELTLVIGRYAQDYHLRGQGGTLTDTVRAWRERWPAVVPMPHPSPRNNPWLRRNPWFEAELLPALRERIDRLLA